MLETGALEKKPIKPSRRYGHTATVIDNHLYIFGGKDFNVRVNDLYDINLDNNKCDKVKESNSSQVPSPRNQHSAIAYNKCLYIFGGISDSGELYNDIHQFNPGFFL